MRRFLLGLALVLGASAVLTTGWTTPHKTKTATVKIIQLKNGTFAFSPKTITVKPGTVITWNNVSGTDHTITFKHHTGVSDIPPNTKKELTFKKVGTYTYMCEFHPYMKAKVVVKKG